nr:MAG TPA: Albumin I chain a [Caudoviricetes sp.]
MQIYQECNTDVITSQDYCITSLHSLSKGAGNFCTYF